MTAVVFLSFRDVSSTSTAVTAGEVYSMEVEAGTDWAGASVAAAEWVPWDHVPDLLAGKRVCFLVHGFNVPLAAGVGTLGPAAQAYQSLGGPALTMTGADIVVPVLWPGDGFIAWSYFTAFDHAQSTGARFTDFLRSSATRAAEVSFFSHSLGARVVLETVVQTLAAGACGVNFGLAILAAAAIDDGALDSSAYAAASGPGGLSRIVILTSLTDQVLADDYPLGDVGDALLFAGYAPDLRALGRFGPAFAAGSAAAPKSEWYAIDGPQNHGDYLPIRAAPPADWPPKPVAVGFFSRDVVDGSPFVEPCLQNWAVDRTGAFRPGWIAKL